MSTEPYSLLGRPYRSGSASSFSLIRLHSADVNLCCHVSTFIVVELYPPRHPAFDQFDSPA